MKRTSEANPKLNSDELAAEYSFDYSKPRPNRFAGKLDKRTVVVLLAPDVAEVFRDDEAVNNALRAIINAYPRRRTAR
jgi:hypothetical protein